MDGLLIDSEPFWRQSHREVMNSYGIAITEDDVRAMAGRRTDDVVNEWRRRFHLTRVPTAELKAQIEHQVVEYVRLNGRMLPGVQQAVKLFADNQIPMAVASSSAPFVIDAVLAKLDLAPYMQLAYSAVHEEFGKPHPAVFLTTANKLGVAPEHCLVFEDSISGVRAAKAAGMRCVAVPEKVMFNDPAYGIADKVLSSLEGFSQQLLIELSR